MSLTLDVVGRMGEDGWVTSRKDRQGFSSLTLDVAGRMGDVACGRKDE